MIRGIDHIGLVTADLPGAAAALSPFPLVPFYEGVAEPYRVACQFWRHQDGDGVAVELVSPVGPDAAVAGHLARQGPGLHHIAFEVDDISAEVESLRRRGVVVIDPVPQRGARPGMLVTFAHLGPATGLLVELVQYR